MASSSAPSEPVVSSPSTTPDVKAEFIAAAGSDRVFFNYDQAILTDAAQATLRGQANWLEKNPAISITIEGHCDERGTREYNLGLGERRASAVQQYLTALGVNSSRIKVISFGKERPEAAGSSEAAYAQNRRAVTILSIPAV